MKKLLTLLVTAVLSLTMIFGLTGCGDNLALGKEYVKADSQLDAVIKLDNGDVDAIVIDSIMAGYYAVEGEYAGKIATVPNLVLAQEKYGIAGRKNDEALISKINEGLLAARDYEALQEIASEFGIEDSLAVGADATNPYANATDNSWNDIVSSGKIVIGYTLFAPIAYKVNDELTGFDIELAKAIVEYLNYTYETNIEVEFLIINWDAKEALLEEGTIDLVWNGMTITPARQEAMCISIPYLNNNQVAVVKAENVANYTNKASFANAVMSAEKGSAGESVILGK